VWSKALKVRGVRMIFPLGSRLGAALRRSRRLWVSGVGRKAFQRQEGTDAGDSVRLHGRSKALKGEPHERIRHETRPAGSGRIKAPGGCENLEAQVIG
jgi:hypothetical protein